MEARNTGYRVVLGSNTASDTSLRNLGNYIYPACQCLSEETLNPSVPSISCLFC